MADEEKNESTEETPEETPADEPAAEAAEEAPAEVPAADEAAPEEPQGDDSADEQAAERDAADSGTPAGEAEDVAASGSVAGGDSAEALTPKQQRKLARSQHAGEARPERSPEERASERAAERARLAGNRRRRRATERQEHPAGTGTPRTDREPGSKKVRLGTVVSDKADKTITVQVEVVRRHPVYGKVIRRSNTIHAHDERNEAHEGDVVRVIESRPLSRTKRWRLVEVLERAR